MQRQTKDAPRLSQVASRCVQIHTCQTGGRLLQVAEILLDRRPIILDTSCFVSIMKSGSPILAFSNHFEIAVLNHDIKFNQGQHSSISNVLSLDIRTAKTISILEESLHEYSMRCSIPGGTMDSADLPFGIKVVEPAKHYTSSEAIMRAAMPLKVSSEASTKEIIAVATLYDSIIRLLSHAHVSEAIFVSSEASFFNQFQNTIQTSIFDSLEWLLVESTPVQLPLVTKDLLLRSSVFEVEEKPKSFLALLKPSKLARKTLSQLHIPPVSPRKWLMDIMNEDRTTKHSAISRRNYWSYVIY